MKVTKKKNRIEQTPTRNLTGMYVIIADYWVIDLIIIQSEGKIVEIVGTII